MTAPDALDLAGLRVVAMDPAFAPALVRFHESLTAATTRSRFFTIHEHLTPDEVARFTNVDHRDREALVAIDGDGEIVAVARFDRLPGSPTMAEVAFVVADAWQHRGLGAALFARLIERAAELGVTKLVADTLAGNRAMRSVFRHGGHPIVEHVEAGVVSVVIDLA